MMKAHILLLLTTLLVVSCNVDPQPFEFGTDGCDYCKMTIVDRQHASQLVTNKGKVYKFDAIECMIHHMEVNKEIEYAHTVVADFTAPGTLIDAKKAIYLISPEISSPMGAFLSAFANEQAAQKTKRESGGNLYYWNDLLIHLRK
ncbi:nitrous oxide reductase accessory protein NosL [Constantimarinum furrinae]|uniref:Nitrous oxide reduction associated protein NosL n=1 Tax=Constantimarinum furrinae TaxID=2562285 RepID=A0A7G8PXM3_9FLAO|nr:nitrous oxide reductase accessory protein NosL [Constantimarinum furrinae]QNJ99089.1 nitrous oxide reduction associated protein NosL [Constantimarinum furrinae]